MGVAPRMMIVMSMAAVGASLPHKPASKVNAMVEHALAIASAVQVNASMVSVVHRPAMQAVSPVTKV